MGPETAPLKTFSEMYILPLTVIRVSLDISFFVAVTQFLGNYLIKTHDNLGHIVDVFTCLFSLSFCDFGTFMGYSNVFFRKNPNKGCKILDLYVQKY